jgi:integrase/recombinase XerC
MSNAPATASGAAQQATIDAAMLLLDKLGISPADLTAVPRDRPELPTIADYVPVVSTAVTDGTRKAYGSYWNRVVEHWGGHGTPPWPGTCPHPRKPDA